MRFDSIVCLPCTKWVEMAESNNLRILGLYANISLSIRGLFRSRHAKEELRALWSMSSFPHIVSVCFIIIILISLSIFCLFVCLFVFCFRFLFCFVFCYVFFFFFFFCLFVLFCFCVLNTTISLLSLHFKSGEY